ncbi:hypothetical protein Tco_0671527 [Tanacetum coccineum]
MLFDSRFHLIKDILGHRPVHQPVIAVGSGSFFDNLIKGRRWGSDYLDCVPQCVFSYCSSSISSLDHPLSRTLEQLDRSLVGKIQIVDVGKLWEHIPIVGWMIVENKRCGELRIGTNLMDKVSVVVGLNKPTELIGKHEADQHW